MPLLAMTNRSTPKLSICFTTYIKVSARRGHCDKQALMDVPGQAQTFRSQRKRKRISYRCAQDSVCLQSTSCEQQNAGIGSAVFLMALPSVMSSLVGLIDFRTCFARKDRVSYRQQNAVVRRNSSFCMAVWSKRCSWQTTV